MSEFDASGFLAEVIADPDNNAPRLIYADWLEEQGSPRGEFIRIQCELEEIDELDPGYLDLRHRNDELLDLYGSEWANEIGEDVRRCVYRRGFVETVTVTARSFAKSGDRLFQAFPVRWVRMNYLKGTAKIWQDCEVLQQLRFLDVSHLKIPDEDLLALLSSPYLSELRGLKLGGQDLTFTPELAHIVTLPRIAQHLEELDFIGFDEEIRRLWSPARKSVGFPSLRSLRVRSHHDALVDLTSLHYAGMRIPFDVNDVSFGPLEAIDVGELSGTGARNLATLPLDTVRQFRSAAVSNNGMEHLSKAGLFDSVESLDLGHSGLLTDGIEPLFAKDQLGNCTRLVLRVTHDGSHAEDVALLVNMLSAHEPLKSLRSLRLSHLQAGNLKQLAASPLLVGLQELILYHSVLDDKDLRALADSPLAGSLRQLKLDHTNPTAAGVEHLSNGRFPKLLNLTIDMGFRDYAFGAELEQPVISLLESEAVQTLQVLSLRALGLTAETLMAIAERSHLPELRILNFEHNDGSNDSMCQVLDSERLPRLRHLSLKWCKGLRRSKKFVEKYGNRLSY